MIFLLVVLQCHLRRAVLEIIASGIAQTRKDLEHFFKCTLLDIEHKREAINFNGTHTQISGGKATSEAIALIKSDPIKDSLKFLEQYEFIRMHSNEDEQEEKIVATRLGYACLGKLNYSDFFILHVSKKFVREIHFIRSMVSSGAKSDLPFGKTPLLDHLSRNLSAMRQ